MARCLCFALILAPCPVVCCVYAGHPEERAAACAASLLTLDESTAGHVEYPLYYYNDKLLDRARQIFSLDASAFSYSFNYSLPSEPWVKGMMQIGAQA